MKPGSATPWYYYTDCTSPAPLCSVGWWREMPLQAEVSHLSNMRLVHKAESLRSRYSIRETKSSHFMIPKGSVPCSQTPSTPCFTVLDKFGPHHCTQFFFIHFNFTLSSTIRYSNLPVSFRISEFSVSISHLPRCATWPAHLMLYLITCKFNIPLCDLWWL